MVDKDLLSIQEARTLVRCAKTAQAEFADSIDQAGVDSIVEAIAEAARNNAESLAKMAVEETGFGKVKDKKIKNLLAGDSLYHYIKDMKTIGVLNDDTNRKVLEIATPAGVIAGLMPSTNPTSTAIYKAMIAIKSGNAIVISPHPSAVNCISKTVEMIRKVIEEKRAPKDLVTVMSVPSLEGTAELMKQADLILATGGPGMVKAAYSSGTPALGVGSGNVPAFIERSADIKETVSKIFASKTFDNGTVCASEQAIVVESVIADQVKEEMVARGGYFLEGEKLAKIKKVMERANGSMNPEIVGKDAAFVAKLAGIEIPANTRIMLAKEEGVGPKFPFSKEKLTTLLGFYSVRDWEEGCELCFKLLKNGGMGHSLAIHSNNETVIRNFAMKKPVSRLLVNTPSTHGAVGITTDLPPSFTLGCGTVGGSSTSDNVGPQHLFNIRRVAYETKVLEEDTAEVETVEAFSNSGVDSIDVKMLTKLIMEQLKALNVK